MSGPRTFVRQCPPTRIPLPSPAAAAACLPTSGPPALFGTRRAARCPFSGHDGDLPVPRDASHHDRSPLRRFPGMARLSAPCGFLAVGGAAPIRALPRIWRTVPCDASTAYAAALQPGTGSSPPVSDAVTPGSSSRQRRTWRPIDAGHSSTASPRRHQLSSYRNACRHWPEGRLLAPSLPDSRHSVRAVSCRWRVFRHGGSDGARHSQASQRSYSPEVSRGQSYPSTTFP